MLESHTYFALLLSKRYIDAVLWSIVVTFWLAKIKWHFVLENVRRVNSWSFFKYFWKVSGLVSKCKMHTASNSIQTEHFCHIINMLHQKSMIIKLIILILSSLTPLDPLGPLHSKTISKTVDFSLWLWGKQCSFLNLQFFRILEHSVQGVITQWAKMWKKFQFQMCVWVVAKN